MVNYYYNLKISYVCDKNNSRFSQIIISPVFSYISHYWLLLTVLGTPRNLKMQIFFFFFSVFHPLSLSLSLVYELLSPPCSSCTEERPNVNSPLFLPHFSLSLLPPLSWDFIHFFPIQYIRSTFWRVRMRTRSYHELCGEVVKSHMWCHHQLTHWPHCFTRLRSYSKFHNAQMGPLWQIHTSSLALHVSVCASVCVLCHRRTLDLTLGVPASSCPSVTAGANSTRMWPILTY